MDMTLEEAKTYLEHIGIKVSLFPDTKAPIRGGTRLSYIEEGILVLDPFWIRLEKQICLTTIFRPDRHIIHASPELRQTVTAIENLYRLTQHQEEKYHEITTELIQLQYNGIIATIASAPNIPAILVSFTEQVYVEGRYTFMLENAQLAEQNAEYRIYPHNGQWTVQKLLNDETPLKLVPDIGQAVKLLLELRGRK